VKEQPVAKTSTPTDGTPKRGRGRPRKDGARLTINASAPKPTNKPNAAQNAEWLAEYTRLKTEARSVSGSIAALGARVKSGGGDWKNLKKVHDLKKLDPDEARAELDGLVALAAQNDIRVTWMGDQAALTDVLEQNQPPPKNSIGSRDLAIARAGADGFNSGRHGGMPHDNPYPPGSEEYVEWHDKRDEAAAAMAAKNPGRAARVAAAKDADASLPSDEASIF
jgi:uncharacterized protein (UPF0335 family)